MKHGSIFDPGNDNRAFYISDNSSEKYFAFEAIFRQTMFQTTKQARAYDIIDLFADVGGYIGMFLGYGMLTILFDLIILIKNMRMRLKARITRNPWFQTIENVV